MYDCMSFVCVFLCLWCELCGFISLVERNDTHNKDTNNQRNGKLIIINQHTHS